jgi:hypothetical protein
MAAFSALVDPVAARARGRKGIVTRNRSRVCPSKGQRTRAEGFHASEPGRLWPPQMARSLSHPRRCRRRVVEEDTRAPEELLDEIERRQKIVAAAMAEPRRL